MLPQEWKNSFACGASWWMRAKSVCSRGLKIRRNIRGEISCDVCVP